MTVKTNLRETIERLKEEDAREVLDYALWLLEERDRATRVLKEKACPRVASIPETSEGTMLPEHPSAVSYLIAEHGKD